MRIIFYSHVSQLGNGGAESLLSVVVALSQKHECCVITRDWGDLNQKLNENGVQNKVIPFRWASSLDNKLDYRSVFRSLLTIRNWFLNLIFNKRNLKFHLAFIEQFRAEIIYTNTSVVNIGVQLAKRKRIPHIWHLREYPLFDYSPDFGAKYLKRYLKKSHTIIVNSEMLKSYYNNFASELKIKVVYNGFDTDNSYPRQLRQENGKRPYVFLIVGALIDLKNHKEAIEASKFLKSKGYNFKLEIVGDGPLKDSLYSKVEDLGLKNEVLFLGQRKNVSHFYNKADCYIMCSKYETFGRVTVEAMLHGLPILGKNIKYNATKEIIRDEVDGFLYNNINDLMDRMEWMILNKEICFKMGNSARSRAENIFSLNRCVDKIDSIISNV